MACGFLIKEALAIKSKIRKGSKKMDGGSVYKFNETPKTLCVCVCIHFFWKGFTLPSNSQGFYDVKRVRNTTLYTILKSGPLSFKMPQNILEVSAATHHLLTRLQFLMDSKHYVLNH